MGSGFWHQIAADGHRMPADRDRADLASELTALLGSADPGDRDRIARPTLAAWIRRGEYDDLLPGLGDGMVAGLEVGLGECGSDTVFRRCSSAVVLAECLARDNVRRLVSRPTVLAWGDRLLTWFLLERDLRGPVPGKGWAHAVAKGADALAVLAGSPEVGAGERLLLLDVLAERMTTAGPLLAGEPDRVAAACVRVLARGSGDLDFEPWVDRLAVSAQPSTQPDGACHSDAYAGPLNSQALLRALFVQVSLAADQPPRRADLLVALAEALRTSNADFLDPG